MKFKILSLVAGLLILLGVAGALLQFDGAETSLDRSRADVMEDEGQPSRSSDAGVLQTRETNLQSAEVGDLERGNQLDLAAESEATIFVGVFDAEDGSAVAGIDVYLYLYEDLRNAKREPFESEYDLVRRIGTRYRSDADGGVNVRSKSVTMAVMAFSDQFIGVADCDPNADSVVVYVHAYPSVDVRVVDQAGKAVIGASVATRTWETDDGRGYFRDQSLFVTSGPDGRARVSFWSARKEGYRLRHFVALSGIFKEPIQVAIDIENPPKGLVTLVQPAAGRMNIIVKESATVPVPEMGTYAYIVRRPTDAMELQDNPDSDERSNSISLKAGHGLSDRIALGEEWQVSIRFGWRGPFETLTKTVVGPTVNGEVVDVVFQMPEQPSRVVLRGRAVDEAGEPLRSKTLWATNQFDDDPVLGPSRDVARTTAEGSFELTLNLDANEQRSPSWLTISQDDSPIGERRFEMDLKSSDPRYCDLGDIQLLPAPLLVQGRVIGPAGEGLEGIEIGLLLVDDSPWAAERRNPVVKAKSYQDGQFEIHSSTKGAEFDLVAEATTLQFEGLRVLRGQEGLVIQMTAKSHLLMRSKSWDDQPFHLLDGFLFSLKSETESWGEWRYLHPSGLIDCYQAPGRYDLTIVHKSDTDRPFLVRKGLVLEAGTTLNLGEVQLTQPGIKIELRLRERDCLSASMRRSKKGEVRAFEPGTDSCLHSSEIQVTMGPHVFFVERLPVDMELRIPGCRLERWTMTQAKALVDLRPGLELRIHVDGLGQLPSSAGARVALLPASSEDHDYLGLWDSTEVNLKRSEVVFHLQEPGAFKVKSFVGADVQYYSGLYRPVSVPLSEILVRDQESPQKFNLALDPEAVEKAFISAGGKR